MISRPRKRFAQHWLHSEPVLQAIVAAAQLNPHDRVLEIGPGTGILTERLLAAVNALVSVEIDRDLAVELAKRFSDRQNFLLIEQDFLTLDLHHYLSDFPQWQHPNKVVANIPYNITGPILERLLGTLTQPVTPAFDSIVLLVQKEVADRLCARPASKAYGALTIRVQYLAACEQICSVPAKAFYPPPKVDSAVVRLTPRPIAQPAMSVQHLEMLLKAGFSSRRKMLRNNLKPWVEPETLSQLLEHLHQSPQARAEELSLTDWISLSDSLLPVASERDNVVEPCS
jgi:16S rRNA (adenine1518-N6/adenine1519-N6)-dimethyltransferase